MIRTGQKRKRAVSLQASKAIGVFDSGLGGLTVVRQIRRILPSEKIVYLGDLAHLPYGTKSVEEIKNRSNVCSQFLLKKKVKAIVIACNSASSAAYESLKKTLNVPIVDVITPVVTETLKRSENFRIGIIATKATIESGSYVKALKKNSKKATFYLKACQLFVPLVEEGWFKDSVTVEIAKKYLGAFKKKKVDTLILGCTHYPLLKKTIRRVMGSKVRLIDSAVPTALEVEKVLKEKGILSPKRKGSLNISVTDSIRDFTRIGEAFLGEELKSVRLVRIL